MTRDDDIELTRLRFSSDTTRSDSSSEVRNTQEFSHVPYVLLVFILAISFSDSVQSIPLLQIWRFFLCQDSVDNHKLSIDSSSANLFAASKQCSNEQVSAAVAALDGWVTSAGMLLSVISSLFWGRASDVKGRQWTFRMCALGTILSQIMLVLGVWSWPTYGPIGVYFSSLVGGLFGAPAAMVSVGYAMLTDVLDEKARLTWYMRTVGVFYGARIVGPSVGSWLLSKQLLYPTYACTLVILISLPVLKFMPETSLISSRKTFSMQNEIRASLSSIGLCFSNRNLAIIASTNFSYYFGISVLSILTIYVNTTYSWSMQAAGYLASYQAVLKFVAATLLIPYLKQIAARRSRYNNEQLDTFISLLSLAIDSVSWLMIAALPAEFLLFSVALGCLGVGATSSMKALAASQVNAVDHGRLFAGLGVIDALAAMLAAPSLAWVYGVTLKTSPAVVFVVAGVIFAISALAYLWYKPEGRAEPEYTTVLFQNSRTSID